MMSDDCYGNKANLSDFATFGQQLDLAPFAVSAAIAIADAPFAELENQSRDLAALAAYGVLSKSEAADVAYFAALAGLGPGMVRYYGADAIQEIIATGFEMEDPKPVKPRRSYRTPESTEAAFWYVVSLNDEAYLTRWLADHPEDAPHLKMLLEDRCRPLSS
jgi:hypothetical protein